MVRSAYGSHPRDVTIVVAGLRHRRHPAPPALVVLVSALGLGAGLAGAAAVVVAWRLGRTEPDDDVVTGVLYLFGVPWALVGVGCALTLVAAIPDLWRRRVVEGQAFCRRVLQGEAHQAPEHVHYFVAVDDGRADRLLAHPLGRERWQGRPRNRFHWLTTGDRVRLTVAPGLGHVFRVEVLTDEQGRPVPPVGTLPAMPPGAPVTAEEVVRHSGRIVRRVEESVAAVEGLIVRSWTFHLTGDGMTDVRVHVAEGERAAEAIVRAGGSTGPAHARSHEPGTTRHDRGLVVARGDAVAVGVQRAASMSSRPDVRRWDETLARQVLHRWARGS